MGTASISAIIENMHHSHAVPRGAESPLIVVAPGTIRIDVDGPLLLQVGRRQHKMKMRIQWVMRRAGSLAGNAVAMHGAFNSKLMFSEITVHECDGLGRNVDVHSGLIIRRR